MGLSKRVNLTKADVENLEPGEKVLMVSDLQARGLYLQVTPNGAKSWVLRYRVHGKPKFHTLGRWPELSVPIARDMAIKMQGDISSGKDPQSKRREEREAKTVQDLTVQFRVEHLPNLRPSSRRLYELAIDRWILPALGSKRVKDVGSPEVAVLLAKIRAETPKGVMANRVRAVISKMFALASVWGFRPAGTNPAQGQVRAVESKKDRPITDKELLVLGATLRHLEPAEDVHALAAIRLYLLTGMRKSEILGDRKRDKETGKLIEDIPALPWTAVDLDAGEIRLAHHKTSKRKGARVVPLCSSAVALLENLPRVLGNPYVIPGYTVGQSLVGLTKIWGRIQEAVAALQKESKIPKKDRVNLDDVTLHGLRHGFASLGARLGYPESFTGALLGHVAGTVTAGYARLGIDPLRDAVEVIGGRMAALLDGKVDLAKEAEEAKAAKIKAKEKAQ